MEEHIARLAGFEQVAEVEQPVAVGVEVGEDFGIVDRFRHRYDGRGAGGGGGAVGKVHRVSRPGARDPKTEGAFVGRHRINEHFVDEKGSAQVRPEPGATLEPLRQLAAAIGHGVVGIEVGVEEIGGRAGVVPLDKAAAQMGAERDIVANADDLDLGQGGILVLLFGDNLDVLYHPVLVAVLGREIQGGIDHHRAVASDVIERDYQLGRGVGLGGAVDLAIEEEVFGRRDADPGGGENAELPEGAGALLVGKGQPDFAGQGGAAQVDGDKPVFAGVVGIGLPKSIWVAVDDPRCVGGVGAGLPQTARDIIALGLGFVGE